jgi:alcohol dehydrogenase (cytochrome c)
MKSKSTILVGLAVVLGVSYAIASRQGAVNKPDDSDWLYVDHDLAGTRYSYLKQINTKNVSQMAKVCVYTFPDKEPSQTAPIVSAGVMYLTTAHYTVAVDGSDCHVVWTSKWSPRDHEAFNTHRGAAISGGKVIRGTGDGFLLALDAKDGHTLWSRQIANPKEGYFISMPPLVHGDLVYIGPAGAEWASKGWVGAFRITDGSQAWRFNIVPDDGDPGANTWGTNPAAREHGGGNLWTPMTFDEEKNLLYVPGGNAAPDIYDEGRPGTNLYTNSLIALDAMTGHLAWYRQFIPHDVHDYDVTHVGPMFKAKISGSTKNVVASTGKDGMLRLLDRDSTEILYSVPFTNRVNAEAPVTTTPVRVCPASLGGQEWNGSAYDIKLNLLVAPATDWCAEFKKDVTSPDPEKEHTHGWYFVARPSSIHGPPRGDDSLRSMRPLAKKSAATTPTKPMVAGVTATEGDLVFTGELTGDLLALDARTGKVLVRRALGGPAGGGVVIYNARGVQNVAIVSGFVGIYNSVAPEIGGGNTSVTIFRLPGK